MENQEKTYTELRAIKTSIKEITHLLIKLSAGTVVGNSEEILKYLRSISVVPFNPEKLTLNEYDISMCFGAFHSYMNINKRQHNKFIKILKNK